MKNQSSVLRIQSPTPSDNSKRPYQGTGMDEEFDINEKFQKVRKIDSPKEGDNINGVQFPSPQYIPMSVSNKSSPKPEKRPMSPKSMYPAPIQKFLTGKAPLNINQAVDKLKSPSPKTFKNQIEKMRLLGRYQEQEIEANIVFRKAYSNSPSSLSPARSTSPVGSPMMLVSPRNEEDSKFQNSDNIVMTFDDDDTTNAMQSPQPSVFSEVVHDKSNLNNQNILNRMPGVGSQGSFPDQQGNQKILNSDTYNQQIVSNLLNLQINQGSPSRSYQQNNVLQRPNLGDLQQGSIQWSGGNKSPNNELTPQNISENHGFDRGNCKFLADSQLNAIQSIMQAKRTVSPGEPNMGLMQYFQKRNSNPENNFRNLTQQPFYQTQNNTLSQANAQNFYGGFGLGNQQNDQYNLRTSTSNLASNAQQPHLMIPSNFNFQQQQFNPQDLEQKLNETALKEEALNTNASNFEDTQQCQKEPESGFTIETSKQNNWTLQDQFNTIYNLERCPHDNRLLDPDAFLVFDKNDSEDFDMNIIPSDVTFIPNRSGFTDLFDNKFDIPDIDGRDPSGSPSNGIF